ncbi:MAG: InlB B-repeat-containing protein [Muribaculaceae bacterium]|nr:InlB B-repeat-containing protein [Muribaculaceae bacterium]
MKNKILLLLGFLLTLSLPLIADNGWTVNPYDYRYDMSAYVKLEIDGDMAADLADYDVAAFCGDECRGILDVRTAGGSQYGYIRIRSNASEGEVIDFKIIDKVSGESLRCKTTLDFVSDSSVGLPSSPFVVNGVNLYEIVFEVDGESIVTQQYYGDALEAPENPVKEGYEFTGWNPELPVTVPAEDLTFTATFKVLSYTVSYLLDNEVFEQSVIEYGAPVAPPEAPEKEGHTFSGWQDVPETMPAHDLEILGSNTVNQYKLTYVVDGAAYKEFTVDYGTAVAPEPVPSKEGYTFSGWDDVPENMPAHDVTVSGTFSINSYKAVFKIDGEILDTKVLDFGQNVVAPEAPVKEGHTFSGWQDVPETMPAHDIEILGSYTVNQYKLTYVVDGAVYKEFTVDYGTTIVPEATPGKEGYTFSGWNDVPTTMPAHDVTVSGTFSSNSYSAVFIIDGEILETKVLDFGQNVVAPEAPVKEGHSFIGWQDVPETMPAHDIEILGSYTVNQYMLTYVVDGELYKEFTVDYGTAVVPEPVPAKEGFTFSGWNGVPDTMPAHDVTVTGTFSANSYSAVFIIDGEVFDTKVFEIGEKVETPEVPQVSGYTFAGWQGLPDTMPAHDIEVTGWYVSNVEITFSRKQIHLNCTQYENASIRYTTDGSNPSSSYGEVYSSPFLPENDCTIKAVAFKDGSVTTDVSSYVYFAEEHTVPNLNIVPVYLDRMVVLIPDTKEEIIAATDSILMNDQVVLRGGEEIRQLEFPTEILGNVAVFEWKSEELLERGPVGMSIEYAQAPKIDYDGVNVRISNDIGRNLIYGMRYDDGKVFENEEVIPDGYHSFTPELTGVLECFAYDDGLFRSDASQYEIHAIRFDEERTVMLNHSGFLGQAIGDDDGSGWESLTIIGPMGSDAPVDSQDMDLVASLSGLHHIDLSAASPLQGSYADFSGLDRLMSLSMPKHDSYACDWNLDKISLLSAIKWNMSEPMTADMFAKVANRHALIYVDDLDLAPENAINVVCGGYATNLTLTHDYPFCVIDEFVAGEATFTKNFSRPTYIGQSRGWETMWIPFDVDQVIQMDERQREILPFLAIDPDDKSTPGFWLSSPDGTVGDWVDHDSIKGGVPYIIAMPNNPDYIEEFNIRGNVAFVGHDVKVSDIVSEAGLMDEDGNQRIFRGSYIPMSSSDYVFTLTEEEVEGEEEIRCVFSPDGDEIRPFECWFEGAPGMKKISFGGNTDSVAQLFDPKDGVSIWQEDGNVAIYSSIDMTAAVADMTGGIVRWISLKAGETNFINGLTPGVYIIANRKVLVK